MEMTGSSLQNSKKCVTEKQVKLQYEQLSYDSIF